LHNIMNYVKSNSHTNIILMNVPYWYDIPNSISVNKIISVLNRKLEKLVKVFPHTSFLKTDTDRNLFTNHGLHLNKLGKQLVHHLIASYLYSIFEQKNLSSNHSWMARKTRRQIHYLWWKSSVNF
jgi:lysophospholipase L1-like esterase